MKTCTHVYLATRSSGRTREFGGGTSPAESALADSIVWTKAGFEGHVESISTDTLSGEVFKAVVFRVHHGEVLWTP